MTEVDDFTKTVQRLCKTHAGYADRFARQAGKTIAPPRPDSQAAAQLTLRLLGGRRGIKDGAPSRTLDLGEVLGEGGMGVVRLATQISLGRPVAVKSLRRQSRNDAAIVMLLQEAWVTGSLEHPNILPVYDIELDEEGLPQVVLKRIGGVHWGELMSNAAEVHRRFGEENLLEWNLRILQQVCNAAHFAHSHKIIHRDLKPENVMIGEFGEVYILDWGLAVSLEDDGTGRLPLLSDSNKLAGTPCYMAPETIGGVDAPLSERTDIYLLGSILFEIMAGRPPHVGENQEQVVASVLRSYPDIPASAPPELARICRRAMLPDPSRRYRSAEQMRTEINRFIQHQGSTRLELKAQERLDNLLKELSEKSPNRPERSQHLYNLFGECRFAYRQAVELWSENEAAIRGLRRAIEAMVEYELGRGEVGAAATLMAELDKPSAELQQRMREAADARQKEQQRIATLESMGRQLDISIGEQRRIMGAMVLGLLWTVSPLLSYYSLRRFGLALSHWPPLTILSALFAVILVMYWIGREELTETAISRRLLGGAFLAISSTIVLQVTAIILGMSAPMAESLWPFGWFCISAMLAVTVDRRLIPMALGFLAALFASASWPDYRFHAMTVSNFFMTINMFYVWMPRSGSSPAGGKAVL